MAVLQSMGLEDVIAAVTGISDIEPEEGNLAYRGYDIYSLVEHSSFEEAAFLLLFGRLPGAEELDRFCDELSRNRAVPRELIELFRRLPPHAHPIDVLRTAIAFLGAVDPEANDLSRDALFRKSVRTAAKIPTAIAASFRIALGHEPIPPLRQLTHAQNFLYMLSGYGPDEYAVSCLDDVLILYAEHESDVSSFTARVSASSLTDYHSSITAAIGTLKGKLHGGASEQAMRMLLEIKEIGRVEEYILDALGRKQRIMGFGHRVYKKGDARARIMKQLSGGLANKVGDVKWHQLCEKIEEIVFRERGLYHNIELYTGPILLLLGIPIELCSAVFAAGRIAGWSAHIIEQQEHNRLIRPRFAYQGPKRLVYEPPEKRLSQKALVSA